MQIIKLILEIVGILVISYFVFYGIAMGIIMLIERDNAKRVENYKKYIEKHTSLNHTTKDS